MGRSRCEGEEEKEQKSESVEGRAQQQVSWEKVPESVHFFHSNLHLHTGGREDTVDIGNRVKWPTISSVIFFESSFFSTLDIAQGVRGVSSWLSGESCTAPGTAFRM
nr:hypothetical protein CFP56_52773 [Quercus suber]